MSKLDRKRKERKYFKLIRKCLAREGIDKASREIKFLKKNTLVVVDCFKDDQNRCHLVYPVNGWITSKLMTKNGTETLTIEEPEQQEEKQFVLLRPRRIRSEIEKTSSYVCDLKEDTEVTVDFIDEINQRGHLISPVVGWFTTSKSCETLSGLEHMSVLGEIGKSYKYFVLSDDSDVFDDLDSPRPTSILGKGYDVVVDEITDHSLSHIIFPVSGWLLTQNLQPDDSQTRSQSGSVYSTPSSRAPSFAMTEEASSVISEAITTVSRISEATTTASRISEATTTQSFVFDSNIVRKPWKTPQKLISEYYNDFYQHLKGYQKRDVKQIRIDFLTNTQKLSGVVFKNRLREAINDITERELELCMTLFQFEKCEPSVEITNRLPKRLNVWYNLKRFLQRNGCQPYHVKIPRKGLPVIIFRKHEQCVNFLEQVIPCEGGDLHLAWCKNYTERVNRILKKARYTIYK